MGTRRVAVLASLAARPAAFSGRARRSVTRDGNTSGRCARPAASAGGLRLESRLVTLAVAPRLAVRPSRATIGPTAWDSVVIDPHHLIDDATLTRAIVDRDERALAEAYRRHGD